MLKIKDEFDLKELENFKFEKYQETKNNVYKAKEKGLPEYYTETGYRWDDGCNTIDVVENRINSNWIHSNKEREIFIYESDYEMGVSDNIGDLLFDLIQAGLVEKVEGV